MNASLFIDLNLDADSASRPPQGCTYADSHRSRDARPGDFCLRQGLCCLIPLEEQETSADDQPATGLIACPAAHVALGGLFPGDSTDFGAQNVMALITWLASIHPPKRAFDPNIAGLLHHYQEPLAWFIQTRADRTTGSPSRVGGLITRKHHEQEAPDGKEDSDA